MPTEHLTHLTFEPHLGLTPWWEIGLLPPDGAPSRLALGLGVGSSCGPSSAGQKTSAPGGAALNMELARISKRYEADGWGTEFRPIIDARWGRWYLSLNPIIGFPLAGDDAWKPDFEPPPR